MTIALDMSNVIYGSIHVELTRGDGVMVNEDFLRHLILNQVRNLNMRFRQRYGRMYLAIDADRYWRKDVFPHYKANRKTSRDKSLVNWEDIYPIADKIMDEIKTRLAFPCVEAEGAEADDVMGWAARHIATPDNPLLIISGDKDMRQLQAFGGNVRQYRPTLDMMVRLTRREAIAVLKDMVMRGDAGDGIPNVLLPDDYYVADHKIKKLTQKRVDAILASYEVGVNAPHLVLADAEDPLVPRIKQNFELISLLDVHNSPVGPAVASAWMKAWKEDNPTNAFMYLASNGLNKLAVVAEDFIPAKNGVLTERGEAEPESIFDVE